MEDQLSVPETGNEMPSETLVDKHRCENLKPHCYVYFCYTHTLKGVQVVMSGMLVFM
jgi:hypothetical protein